MKNKKYKNFVYRHQTVYAPYPYNMSYNPSRYYPVKFSTDFMSDEEIEAMSGEVKIYKLHNDEINK